MSTHLFLFFVGTLNFSPPKTSTVTANLKWHSHHIDKNRLCFSFLSTVSVALCCCDVTIPEYVGLSSSRIHHLVQQLPSFFQFSISMSPSSSLSQKASISHPPPLISTNSDPVIADVIPGLDWSRSRFHPG
ncbi:hypothetical protein CEXT_340641 [Caerostris extrusa]|uniref:Uncharacterized protein n=1 Tax=Caerostris extrusa TaxID=172846 RepID=A0AAV4TBG8_CAEEX|nr:hypothetical protein CEXT_340641 [Caerostris extrusa]